jgi:uncharacterized membrane protein
MIFLIILGIGTTLAAAVGRRRATWRDHARRGMAVAMVVAGVSHLVRPDPFVQHLPDWVPGRDPLVLITGIVEVLLGAALVRPRAQRRLAGRALAGYLVAVLPANVYVAVDGVDVDGQPGGVYHWIRLPLQGVFIAWALWSTGTRDDERTVDLAAGPQQMAGVTS